MMDEKKLNEFDENIEPEFMTKQINISDTVDNTCYIADDKDAEKYLREEAKQQAYLDRLIKLCEDEIRDMKEKLDKLKARKETQSWYKAQLMMYFNSIPDSAKMKTKTQTKYELLHGSLIRKNGGFKTERDDQKIIAWAKDTAPNAVETTLKLKWADLKKDCDISENGCVYKPTGEIIDGIEVIPQADTFEIKMDFGGENNG